MATSLVPNYSKSRINWPTIIRNVATGAMLLIIGGLSYFAFVPALPSDRDPLAWRFEDRDGNGDPANDDTDKDGQPDYLDDDDDGDSVLTAREGADPNEDGDPSDALDTDKDGVPNYLDADDDNDSTTTIQEDPNQNKDPLDDDSDRDGTADYLDPDSPTPAKTARERVDELLPEILEESKGIQSSLHGSNAVPTDPIELDPHIRELEKSLERKEEGSEGQ
jgi:hypothetical protein